MPGQHERDATVREVAQVAGAERACHRLESRVEPTHRSLDGEHVVRHRDERLGEHDGHGGERDLDAERREVLPDQAVAAPRHEQRHAADDGWQHERHREQGTHPARRRVVASGRGTRPGGAEQQAQHGRDRGRRQREPERRKDGRRRQVGGDASPVGPQQQRDERDDEQEQRQRRRHAEHDAGAPPAGIPHLRSPAEAPTAPRSRRAEAEGLQRPRPARSARRRRTPSSRRRRRA